MFDSYEMKESAASLQFKRAELRKNSGVKEQVVET